MIDFIIFVAMVAVFAAGFWAGQTFGTVANLWTRLKATVKGWL